MGDCSSPDKSPASFPDLHFWTSKAAKVSFYPNKAQSDQAALRRAAESLGDS